MENTQPAFNLSADLDDDEVAESVIALNAAETELEIVKVQPSNGNGKEPEQAALFDKGKSWEEHWRGMPEFIQNDLTPFATIYVHFENREDMLAFSKLVGQTVTPNTQCIWYPEATIDETAKLRWIAEPTAPSQKKQELKEILDSK